jgi:hypothetical protein
MKVPKGFNKMTAVDQEVWLIKKLQEVYEVEKELKRLLGTVRGGQRVSASEIDRPDEAILKDPA